MAEPDLIKLAYETLQQGKSIAGLAHKQLSTKLMELLEPEAMPKTNPIPPDLFNELRHSIASLQKLGLSKDQKLLLLLPASRSQELRYLMPIFAKAAALLQKRDPSLQVLIPSGLKGCENRLKDELDLVGQMFICGVKGSGVQKVQCDACHKLKVDKKANTNRKREVGETLDWLLFGNR